MRRLHKRALHDKHCAALVPRRVSSDSSDQVSNQSLSRWSSTELAITERERRHRREKGDNYPCDTEHLPVTIEKMYDGPRTGCTKTQGNQLVAFKGKLLITGRRSRWSNASSTASRSNEI